MAAAPKRTGKIKSDEERADNSLSDPLAVYARKISRRSVPKRPRQQGYDAKRSAGMIPGLAARMEAYLKNMRNER